MILLILRLLVSITLAYLTGKLISKIKLPSILGWLIAGMILGPHALSIMNQEILEAEWYQVIVHILECAVGLMIGTELVWKKIKNSGKSIIITTLTQSIGTFLLVSLVFGITFYFLDIPLYLAFLFGGIALATAPAPALSIVREFKTKGPVTNTLIPMAALDDIVGCVIFFTTIAIVAGKLLAGKLSAGNLPAYMIVLVVVLPLIIGVITGFLAGIILKKERSSRTTLLLLIVTILIAAGVGFVFNNMILPKPVLNFMLIGMAFSATFANIVSEKQLNKIMNSFNPILGIAMIIVILNLGAPLDYHLILGAGVFTIIYIVARALGKYFGAYFGASITKSPQTVKKFLGFTLLPHSGVSLVFTGIAVSVLSTPAPEYAEIIQGTIAAAAVINEIIAVIMAKKGFEWAGEFDKENTLESSNNENDEPIIITISRQHGSGGRQIGRLLSKRLKIPFYDNEIIELSAKSSPIDKSFFENSESNKVRGILQDLAIDTYHDLSVNDKVFLHQSKIIRDIASKESCIIVGRCADYVLKQHSNLIKVFIYADTKTKKDRVVNIYKESDEKTAIKEITSTDKKRALYYNHYTKQQYGEAQNYDVCLNSGILGIDGCVKIIEEIYLTQKEKPLK